MKQIPLTQGQTAIVDDDIYPFLCQFKWQAALKKKRGYFYAIRTARIAPGRNGEIQERMHHYIVGRPMKGFVVDHINGNTIDNRRENLRIVTCKQNSQNQYRHRAGKQIGVGYMPNIKRWRAYLRTGKKNVHLGCFKTQEEARAAYLGSIKLLHSYPELSLACPSLSTK